MTMHKARTAKKQGVYTVFGFRWALIVRHVELAHSKGPLPINFAIYHPFLTPKIFAGENIGETYGWAR
jgi:hypothetical protein